MITVRKTHLALLVALLLIDVTLQSDKRKRQSNPCPEDWVYISQLQKCYGFARERDTWVKAVAVCVSSGAKIIEPKSQDEMDAIVQQMKIKNTGAVWTGGNTIDTEGKWRWFDGTDIGPYQPWDSQNPSNSGGNEHCQVIATDNGYLWNDIHCNTNNTAACEISLSGNDDKAWT